MKTANNSSHPRVEGQERKVSGVEFYPSTSEKMTRRGLNAYLRSVDYSIFGEDEHDNERNKRFY